MSNPLDNRHTLEIELDDEGIFLRGTKVIQIPSFPQEELDFALVLCEVSSASKPLKYACNYRPSYECICSDLDTNSKYLAYFKVELLFRNYIHELSSNYKYKINCQVSDKLQINKRICLLEEIRISKCMSYLIETEHEVNCIAEDIKNLSVFVEIERSCVLPSNQCKSLQSDYKALLENPVFSDVELQVGDELFKAHKNILTSRSNVFEAMFRLKMKESQTGTVKVNGIEPNVMRELLCYIYSGKSDKLDEMPFELFEAADRYELDDLKNECLEFLMFNVNVSNIIRFSELVNMYDVNELKPGVSSFQNKFKNIVRNPSPTP